MKGDLSKSDYICMNQSSHKEESEARTGSVRKSSAPTTVPERKATPHSMRSRRTATWARPHSSDDGYSRHSLLSILFYVLISYFFRVCFGVLRVVPLSTTFTHSDSVLKSASTDFKKLGQRIFVFIIGGATRSEVYKQANPT